MDISRQGESDGAPNPLAARYREWSAETPLVTRSVLQILVAFGVVGLFLSPWTPAVVNTPYFTLFYLELYRLLLAPLAGDSFLSLVFGGVAFFRMGKTMENALGSAAFLWLVLLLALASQMLFLVFTVTCATLGLYEALFWHAQGSWLVVMGLMVAECVASGNPTRRLLCFPVEVPTHVYPVALFALFSIFEGPRVDLACALAVGYAYAYGKLGFAEPTEPRVRDLEDHLLQPLARRPGYITVAAAQGRAAWQVVNDPNAGGFEGWGAANQQQPAGQAPAARGMARRGAAAPEPQGQTLGGTSHRTLTREEMLARRAAALGGAAPGSAARPPGGSAASRPPTDDREVITGPFEAQLMHLTSMGFTRQESAAALRACGGDLGAAVARLSGD